ncbi:MAG: alpha-glucan family phosphorylase, partial [Planctomycetota bacterium]|nr:alpha-glucan family phosphorylase [Planctomycetota bacterium]
VFAPVMLSRRDPLFPYNYIDVLRASDFSVFPSLYEPWGYTPVESLDAGVPTITTDLTGFGRFIATLPADERDAITVLPASVTDVTALEVALESEFVRFLERSDEEMEGLRQRGDAVVKRMSWNTLLGKTIEAYDLALQKSAGRRTTLTRPGASRISRRSVVSLPARSELSPRLHRFSVSAALPVRIARLKELARNLWWAWTPPARALFARIDADALAKAGANPVRFIGAVSQERLEEAAQDEEFLSEYDAVFESFDDYLARPKIDAPKTAYFCAEFALHESLPIYSGGLGVLAGDHLKSASDRALPLVAIGLRYAEGYFHQVIQPDGGQGVAYRSVDPREIPLTEVVGADGKPLRITLTMPERELQASVWRADVGQVPLFLLDTLLGENDPADREITNRLYPSEREPRLRQEMLLGIGGWRLLKALDRTPDVCHLNEGHSAFVLLDRLLDLVEGEGLTFAEAQEVVRASTLFTTHTPVPAGHDRFPEDLMRRFFGRIAERLGLDWEEFLALGLASSYERDFSMTNLALHLAGRANGVSQLHGEVARRLHSDVWPGFHTAEAPLESVTNGVHLATWIGPEIRALYETSLDPDWVTSDPSTLDWTKLESVDDTELWEAHLAQKRRMLQFVRTSCEATALRRGESAASVRKRLEGLDEDALIIGYARRFAPYKRATMIFRDMERLAAILDSAEMPVRLVFAGKSHPDDREGAELVRDIVDFTTDERFAGRVFFVEDYGMEAGRNLVQGVDVWLNTPTRPLEASGTSGMKACANGVPHLSILDGWWCESYDGTNGWVIGNEDEFDNPDVQAERDSRSLYGLLESEVAPLFFDRPGWIEIMKRTLATVPGKFNTHRMVGDYLNGSYRPLGQRAALLRANEFNDARVLAARHMWLKDAWNKVRIEEVSVTDLSSRSIALGEVFEVGARVQLGDLKPDDVAVELYVGLSDPAGELKEPVVIELILNDHDGDGVAKYSGAYMPRNAGAFNYGVRVRPAVESAHEAAALGLVRWA